MKKNNIYLIIGIIVIVLIFKQLGLFAIIPGSTSGTFEWADATWEYNIHPKIGEVIYAQEVFPGPVYGRSAAYINSITTDGKLRFEKIITSYPDASPPPDSSSSSLKSINLNIPGNAKKIDLNMDAFISLSSSWSTGAASLDISIFNSEKTIQLVDFSVSSSGNPPYGGSEEALGLTIYEYEGDYYVKDASNAVFKRIDFASDNPYNIKIELHTPGGQRVSATTYAEIGIIQIDTDGDSVWDDEDFAPEDPNIWEEGQEVEEPTVVYVEAPPTTYYEPTRVSPITATTITTEDEEGLSKNMVALIAAGLGGLYILTSKPKKK